MTSERLQAMKATAESWGDDNPFRKPLLDRLAAMGGLHAPSRTADRFTRRDDIKVELLRETAEAKSIEACPF